MPRAGVARGRGKALTREARAGGTPVRCAVEANGQGGGVGGREQPRRPAATFLRADMASSAAPPEPQRKEKVVVLVLSYLQGFFLISVFDRHWL